MEIVHSAVRRCLDSINGSVWFFYLNVSFTSPHTKLTGLAHLLLAVHLFGQPAEMLTMFTY